MRWISSFLAVLAACASVPAHAGTVTIIEEWVEVESSGDGGSDRFVSGIPLEAVDGIATYGPFRVVDGTRAALVGITDGRSPAEFAAMLRDYPELATLEMVECPGTFDDLANLRLGRMIRTAGIATYVPQHGSVRSGAVELFIAGAGRRIDEGARFAVHAWMDDSGMEATDYSVTAPEHHRYLSYYREMGMAPEQAEAFYWMTNSVSFEQARWLDAADMRGWVQTGPVQTLSPSAVPLPAAAPAPPYPAPRLAYLGLAELDLGRALN